MANIALYRKYRSRTFAEIIGQEHVTEPLIAALRNGRLNHAYLFSGPRGCGKTSSARILARSVNCAKGPTPEPCGECESCRALAPDGPGSIDVIEIDAASHGGVDDARELREKAFFAPVNSRYKVYVIDEAHMVSSAGFNALLKLVEEPPDYVMFVFATTEPDKVLGTIKSRTHHYPFRLVPPGALRAHLERICDSEGVRVDPTVFPLVVRAGGGSVRDSLSVLDQLLAGAGEGGVTYQQAVGLLGVTDAGLIDEACDALAASDGAALFGAIDRVVEAGHEPRRFASDLLERLRDLIVLNQVPDAVGSGLLDVPPDELEHLTGQALRLGSGTLTRMADILHGGLAAMRGTASPRLVLELLCARMLLPGDESTADLLQRMERLERRLDVTGGAPAPAAPPAPTGVEKPAGSERPAPAGGPPAADATAAPVRDSAPPAPPAGGTPSTVAAAPVPTPDTTDRPAPERPGAGQPATHRATSPGALDISAVSRAWEPIVEHTKRRRLVWSLLQNAAPYALDGDTLVLKARSAGIAGRFNDDTVVGVVQDALLAVLGVRWRIRCQAEPDAARGQRGGVAAGPATSARPGAGDRRGADTPTGSGTPAGRRPPETDGWPETARPGGPAQGAEASAAGPASRSRPGDTAPSGPAGSHRPAPTPDSGPGARSAAAPADRATAVTVAGPPAAGPTDFSPDDPGPTGLGSYDEFAPGDEPLDEPLDPSAAPAPARSTEEQAVSLLVQTLGAEKLSES